MTGYVVTRWYRAPEVILSWMHYTQTGNERTPWLHGRGKVGPVGGALSSSYHRETVEDKNMDDGVPQGPVLGPKFFFFLWEYFSLRTQILDFAVTFGLCYLRMR